MPDYWPSGEAHHAEYSAVRAGDDRPCGNGAPRRIGEQNFTHLRSFGFRPAPLTMQGQQAITQRPAWLLSPATIQEADVRLRGHNENSDLHLRQTGVHEVLNDFCPVHLQTLAPFSLGVQALNYHEKA